MNEAENILEVRDLCVSADGRSLVSACSLTLREREIVAVIGPNGGGKSTLLRAIAGLIECKGSVKVRGRIAYIPQHVKVDRHAPLRVEEFLAARLTGRPIAFGIPKRVRSDVLALLAQSGMESFAKRSLGTLSGGELQRVLLAGALGVKPSLLLLDEPASGLDIAGIERMHLMLRTGVEELGAAALLISHDLGSLNRIADRVLGLQHTPQFLGPVREVLTPTALACMYGLHQSCDHDHGAGLSLSLRNPAHDTLAMPTPSQA